MQISKFDSLMKSAAVRGQMNLINTIQQVIDSEKKSFNSSLDKMTIGELLIDANKPENNRKQLEFYYNVLPAGKTEINGGSYLVSEWWRRNMIIYENILKSLTGKKKNTGPLWPGDTPPYYRRWYDITLILFKSELLRIYWSK